MSNSEKPQSKTLKAFLDQSEPEEASAPENILRQKVVEALRQIYDPEIPVNIYDMGLIYDVVVKNADVTIIMTLTTPHCPVAEILPGQVETCVSHVPGVASAAVNLVWSPPWRMEFMSDDARLELGLI